jgi:hypothetical protein
LQTKKRQSFLTRQRAVFDVFFPCKQLNCNKKKAETFLTSVNNVPKTGCSANLLIFRWLAFSGVLWLALWQFMG